MTRRDVLRLGAASGIALYAEKLMAPIRLLAEVPQTAELQGPPAPPKYYFSHAVHSPYHREWVIDGFDQMSDAIDLEHKLLTEFTTADAVFFRKEDYHILRTTTASGAARTEWEERTREGGEAAAMRFMMRRGARERSSVAAKAGLSEDEVGVRIGYADALAQGMERAAPWAGYVGQMAYAHGIEPAFLLAIGMIESNWSARLDSGWKCYGVFQVSDKNSRNYGLQVPERFTGLEVNEGFHPLLQAQAAAAFLRSRILLAGNAIVATSFYHTGEDNALKMMGLAMRREPQLIENVPALIAWASRNYKDSHNRNGFSGFEFESARYYLRAMAAKRALCIPHVEQLRTAMVRLERNMRVHDVLRESFGMDSRGRMDDEEKRLFKLHNPHMPLKPIGPKGKRKWIIYDAKLDAGTPIFLPPEKLDDFLRHHEATPLVYDGKTAPIEEFGPWLPIDEQYAALAKERRENGFLAVPRGRIEELAAEARMLEIENPTRFRMLQRLVMNADANLYETEGFRIYTAGAMHQELPLTEKQRKKQTELQVAQKSKKQRKRSA